MQKTFAGTEFQIALLSSLEEVEPDTLGQLPADAVAAELEKDRKHWLEDFQLDMPIGVVTPEVRKKPNGNYERLFPYFFDSYGIHGWPTYLLFDRAGKLRYIQMGIDPDFEAEFSALIRKLLDEPVTKGIQ